MQQNLFKHFFRAKWSINVTKPKCSARLGYVPYIFAFGGVNLVNRGLSNLNYHPDEKDMAAAGGELGSTPKQIEKGNGLLLYLNHYSFYAQKVS